nr:hypothetical protein [Leptolyngbya sp. Prado105]
EDDEAPEILSTSLTLFTLQLRQGELAKRFGVAQQSLTYQRSKPSFTQWSRSQDPEGIAWNFEPVEKYFYPVEAIAKSVR